MTFWGHFSPFLFEAKLPTQPFQPFFPISALEKVSRSQVLSESASSFRRDAEQLRRLVWWGNVKKMALLISIVVSKLEAGRTKTTFGGFDLLDFLQ